MSSEVGVQNSQENILKNQQLIIIVELVASSNYTVQYSFTCVVISKKLY